MPHQIQEAFHKFLTVTFLLECCDLREYIVHYHLKNLSSPGKNYDKVSTLESDALFLALRYLFLIINCLIALSGAVASDTLFIT